MYTASQLIVVWVFFIFERPHDCFICFGKDPDRKYSIHQYTQGELIDRKMIQKFGGGFLSRTTGSQKTLCLTTTSVEEKDMFRSKTKRIFLLCFLNFCATQY